MKDSKLVPNTSRSRANLVTDNSPYLSSRNVSPTTSPAKHDRRGSVTQRKQIKEELEADFKKSTSRAYLLANAQSDCKAIG
jgi:hypothetical protein